MSRIVDGYDTCTFQMSCLGDGNGIVLIQETDHQRRVLPEYRSHAYMFVAAYSFGAMYFDSRGMGIQLLTCDYLMTPLARLQAARMTSRYMKVLSIDHSTINPAINTLNDIGCLWIGKGDSESMLRLQMSFGMSSEAQLLYAFERAKAWRPPEESLLTLWDGLSVHQKADYVLELHRYEERCGGSLFSDELVERIGPQWMRFAE